MIWRFLPLLDLQVSQYMCRDLDSRVTQREFEAVQDWLNSEKSLHVMRDHPEHNNEIVGCCWGMKIQDENTRKMIFASFNLGHIHKPCGLISKY